MCSAQAKGDPLSYCILSPSSSNNIPIAHGQRSVQANPFVRAVLMPAGVYSPATTPLQGITQQAGGLKREYRRRACGELSSSPIRE
jgi:hypothetical protein